MTLIYPEESFLIRGACFEVYNLLGPGFPESAYQEALGFELAERKIEARPHPTQHIYYKGHELVTHFVPDFVCFGKIIVELKAISEICGENVSQVLGYLKATGFKLGLLVNFGHHPDLEIKRLVH